MIPNHICRLSTKAAALKGFEAMIAEHVGADCPHEWFMHLPACEESRVPRSLSDVLALLPVRVTCAHCLAHFTLVRSGRDGIAATGPCKAGVQ